MLVKMVMSVKIRVTPKYSENYFLFLNYNFNHNNWRSIQIRRVDLDCLGVDEERERRRLQAAVRELGIQGATQVFKIICYEIIIMVVILDTCNMGVEIKTVLA